MTERAGAGGRGLSRGSMRRDGLLSPVAAGALMLVMTAPGQTAVVSVFVDPMIIGLSLDRPTRWRLRQDWWAPVC